MNKKKQKKKLWSSRWEKDNKQSNDKYRLIWLRMNEIFIWKKRKKKKK